MLKTTETTKNKLETNNILKQLVKYEIWYSKLKTKWNLSTSYRFNGHNIKFQVSKIIWT